MPLVYRKFWNRNTGQVCSVPAGRYGNFLNSIKKLVQYVKYNIPRYYVAHLTLTVAENVTEIDFKHLHRVLQFIDKRLKRAGSDFKYVAVKEVQKRGAIHYHVLCVYSKPYIFPSSNDVQKSWRLGFVKINAPKIRMKMNKIAGYIGKYLGKGYEYEALDYKKSFTASQIRQIYKLSNKRLEDVIRKFGKDMAESFSCTYRKVFIEGINVDTLAREKILVYQFKSEWEYVGMEYEPF